MGGRQIAAKTIIPKLETFSYWYKFVSESQTSSNGNSFKNR